MSYRVAIIEFINESNTFTHNRTSISDFRASHYFKGDEIPANFRGTGSEVGGAIKVADEKGWSPVYITAAHAEPNGPVLETARLEITGECLRRLKESGPFDGIFVALHGAMVTETDGDGDSQFLREIRAVVGYDIPIAITLDLHANIFDELADLAQVAVSFRTYPHIDMNEVGVEACSLLDRAMRGEIEPALAISRPPMLLGCDDGRTTDNGPMCRLLESAGRKMQQPGILNVAINAGFTDADVWAAGPCVIVTFDRKSVDQQTACDVAGKMCDEIWSYKDQWSKPVPLDECIRQLKETQNVDGTIVVADFSDNPGSGAYSDCTALIAAMLAAGVTNAAAGALLDPEAVTEIAAKAIGETVTVTIGGKSDPSVGGGPLTVTGCIMSISDGTFVFEGPMFTGLPGTTGQAVCLRVDGIDIMIVSERMQMLDQNIFRAVGIEPKERSILAVKSMQHFKGAFGPIATQIIITDAGGLSSPDLSRRTYSRLRRPVFPLDRLPDEQQPEL
ncbi:M81 family metallopeptidase [Brucella grignonensis]|uniref:Microcystinase C n=1 Tax=Brucella grignonensis TaxID=94627 RepID=A0A256F1Y8_9HYPH|nr:M81 family metallopeptidase [Brucella grignonensis]NKB84464.1 M81 family metallopeptidase [Brucella grignonensis]OYR08431.1 mlrC family protein [Brucella grignonensis]